MSSWAADFSDNYYRRLLTAIRSRWTPCLFRDAPAVHQREPKTAFLRHDVDVSLARAVRLARLESENGFFSTYMVMNAGLMYGLASADSRRAIRQIAALGHEVGLHFDYPDSARAAHGEAPEILESQIVQACGELEDALGQEVRSLSFHRPVHSVIRGPMMVAGRVNGYAAELMERYISDSKGQWREGEPIGLLQTMDGVRTLQVLTHPIWWGESHRTAAERLSDLVEEFAPPGSAERARFEANLAATLPGVPRGQT